MGDYILGLDLGSASIGWAVVDVVTGHLLAAKPDRDGTPGPPGCGVRIFPESVDRKKNVPYTAQRRTAHGMRRQIRRRVHRKRRLLAKLIAAGLWPADLLAQAQLLDQRGRPTVYELRRRALDEPISAFEFGRILRHLCQRRGFKSNRKTARTSDDGKLYRATAQLQNDMDEATPPSRTLGEHLCRIGAGELPLPQKGVLGTDDAHRIRGRYTLRKMFEAEFEKLWTEQEQYIAELRVHGLRDAIHEIIFYQRPLRSARHLIGR